MPPLLIRQFLRRYALSGAEWIMMEHIILSLHPLKQVSHKKLRFCLLYYDADVVVLSAHMEVLKCVQIWTTFVGYMFNDLVLQRPAGFLVQRRIGRGIGQSCSIPHGPELEFRISAAAVFAVATLPFSTQNRPTGWMWIGAFGTALS